MSHSLRTLCARAVLVGVALGTMTVAGAADKSSYETARKQAEAQYDADKAACKPLKSNAQDICMAEAKGKRKVARAELEAKNAKDPAKAEKKVQDAKAEAAYDVAKERCDEQKGDAKKACIQQARAERDRAKGKAEKTADAKKEQRAARGSTAPERKPAK